MKSMLLGLLLLSGISLSDESAPGDSFVYKNEKEKVQITFPKEPEEKPLVVTHTQAFAVHDSVKYELHMMHSSKKKKTSHLKAEWSSYLPGKSNANFIKYKVKSVKDVTINGMEGIHIVMEMNDPEFPVKHSWEFGVKSTTYYRVNLHAQRVDQIQAVQESFLNSLKVLD